MLLQMVFIFQGGRVPKARPPVSGEKYHTKNTAEAQLEKEGAGELRTSSGQKVPNAVNAAQSLILH